MPCVRLSSGRRPALKLLRTPCPARRLRAQVKKCADAGADIVRITVQGRKEAEACMQIREQLFKEG
jgi:hypothetical protein